MVKNMASFAILSGGSQLNYQSLGGLGNEAIPHTKLALIVCSKGTKYRSDRLYPAFRLAKTLCIVYTTALFEERGINNGATGSIAIFQIRFFLYNHM